MTYQTAEDLLSVYDRAPLNRRYWVSFVLLESLFFMWCLPAPALCRPHSPRQSVSPTTEDAVLPTLLFLGANTLLAGLGFALLGIKTHGGPIGFGDIARPRGQPAIAKARMS